MYSVQDSSPLCIMHSSLTLRVSGHAQQIRHFGFASSAGAPVLALLSDAAGTESGIATRHFQASQRCSRAAAARCELEVVHIVSRSATLLLRHIHIVC